MQNAKDTFYVALRNRLALVNTSRVTELRAVARPGILVEEAEAPMRETPANVFVLRWTGTNMLEGLPSALASMTCEIHYGTSGSNASFGLDRGRGLSEMDRELLHMIRPLRSPKFCYTTTPPTPLLSQVFWTEPVFNPLLAIRDLLSRVATITVMGFQEESEL